MNILKDKQYHFLAGCLIALTSVFIGAYGLLFAVLAGVLKECYDWWDYGKPDIYDMLATWAGGLCGYAAVQLLEAL